MGNYLTRGDESENLKTVPPAKSKNARHYGDLGDDNWGILFSCDNCQERIEPNEKRWFCATCDEHQVSYDFCDPCHEKVPHEHPMVLLDPSSIDKPVTKDCVAFSLECRFRAYRERKCFGYLKVKPEKEGDDPEYDWIDYGTVHKAARALGSGLLCYTPTKSFIGICGENSYGWYLSDFACMFGGFVSVPIHVNFDHTAVEYICNAANLVAILVSNAQAPRVRPTLGPAFRLLTFLSQFVELVESKKVKNIKFVILFEDTMAQDQFTALEARANAAGVKLLTRKAVSAVGEENMFPIIGRKGTDIATILYTSGSTGLPKGAISTDAEINEDICSAWGSIFGVLVVVSYMPLAHSMQRSTSWMAIGNGGRVMMFEDDMTKLFEFVQLARPTIFSAVPRVWNILYTKFKEELQLAEAMAPVEKHKEIETALYRKFEKMLGDRIRSISFGGAPTSDEVKVWLNKVFRNSIVTEGYGATEVGGIASNGIKRAEVEIKLLDVPELGYSSKDLPYPRGELWVRKKIGLQCTGYFKDKENTDKNFDSEGFFNTGDIVEYQENSGKLRVIDRRKFFFKLAQGEFIAPEWLESIFQKNPYIHSIFVYGSPLQEFVLAVVVPNANLSQWAKDNNLPNADDRKLLATNPEVERFLLQQIVTIGQQSKVQPYEIPRGLIVEPNFFTVENGGLTVSFKLNRVELTKRYSAVLDPLYDKIAKSNAPDFNVILKRRLAEIVSKTTGLPLSDLLSEGQSGVSLAELGIDSVAAIKLANVMKVEMNTDISIAKLYSSDATISRLAGILSSAKSRQEAQAELAGPAKIDWDAECALPETITASLNKARVENVEKLIAAPRAVLLTGAAGFIGAFLAQALVTKFPLSRVITLIRAPTDALARERLLSTFEKYHIALSDSQLAKLEVLASDISHPLCGLKEAVFDSLTKELDIVYHNACQVNGIFGYSLLKAANVTGTLNVMQIASSHVRKPFIFISTLSAFGPTLGDESTHFTEPNTVLLDMMSGYGASKRVSETHVEKARALGLPAIIIRPGTVTGHSTTGALNMSDYSNKFMAGIVQLEACPDVHSLFDMAPVDYVAPAIVAISANVKNFGKAFHLFNLTSCPTIAQIAEAAKALGWKVAVKPYDQWKSLLAEKPDCVLAPLSSYFRGSMSQLPDYGTAQALAALQGTGVSCPPVSQEVLMTYYKYITQRGVLTVAQ